MGQKNSKERFQYIQATIEKIATVIKTGRITLEDNEKYEEILVSFSREIKFFHAKDRKASKIKALERLITESLQELQLLRRNSIRQRVNSDINYLSKLQEKEKCFKDLEEIGDCVKSISGRLAEESLDGEKEKLGTLKNRLSLIEEIDEDVSLKKNEVFSAISSAQNALLELEMEGRLKQAQEKHCQNKIELDKFTALPESDFFRKHKEFLIQLKNEVGQILEVSENFVVKKKYVLYNIDNNLLALEEKAKENERKLAKKIITEDVISHASTLSLNQNLLGNLDECYKEFEKKFSANCDLKELKEIFKQLNDLKIKIDQKVKVLESQMCEDCELKQPPSKHKIEVIEERIESIKKEIETSKFSKDSQIYKKLKHNLQEYKNQLNQFSNETDENRKIRENLLRNIDNVFFLLEFNSSNRKSSSGDILIDIMSVSTIINEIGDKMKRNNYELEEYKTIEDNLEEHSYYLRNLKISPARTNICKFRDYVLIQIESHLSNLKKLKRSQSTLSGLQQN